MDRRKFLEVAGSGLLGAAVVVTTEHSLVKGLISPEILGNEPVPEYEIKTQVPVSINGKRYTIPVWG